MYKVNRLKRVNNRMYRWIIYHNKVVDLHKEMLNEINDKINKYIFDEQVICRLVLDNKNIPFS